MRLPILFLLAALLVGCGPTDAPRIPDYRTLGELRVATRQDAIAFRYDEDGSSGFEHDLLLALGEHLQVPVSFIVYPDVTQMLRAVIDGEAHLAAAGLARNDLLPLRWSSPLREVDYVLVGRADRGAVRTEADLNGRMVSVRRGSLPADRLERLRKRLPGLSLHRPTAEGDQALLEQAAAGKLDLVATDRLHYAIAQRVFPELTVVWELPIKSQIAWALPLEPADPLAQEVATFLDHIRASGQLASIADRYFGHVRRLSTADIVRFLSLVRERLPRYRAHFQEAQTRTGIDWRLLAALAYQESQWDPLATSRTGVRGMMMLTTETADRLGVRDRLDPRDSILGGARYLEMLRDQLQDDIAEPDRTWMAIAAYNLGMGHLRGARAIARTMRRDHTSWWGLKTVLPLLSRPEYAARLKAGAARGGEAVIMTENIRNYYDILTRIEPPYLPPLQPRGLKLSRNG